MVPFQESFHFPSGIYVVLTDYIEGQSLDKMSKAGSTLELSQLAMVFGQIDDGALEWLKKQRIIHRNIRPDVILIRNAPVIMSWLTGFFECCEGPSDEGVLGRQHDHWLSAGIEFRAPEMKPGERYGNEVDMFSLSAVMDRMLLPCPRSQSKDSYDSASPSPSSHNPCMHYTGFSELSMLPKDSYLHDLIKRGMHTMPDQRLTPLNVQRDFDCILGSQSTEWPPFAYSLAKRVIALQCDRRNGIDLISRESLRTALKALQHSSEFAPMDFPNLKWANERSDFIKLRSAIKSCHASQLKDLAQCLMDALLLARTDGNFTITFTMRFRIYYHSPSLMVNATQIGLVAGMLNANIFESLPTARVLNVYGSPKWRGQYIDRSSLQELSGEMRNHGIDFSCSTFHRTDSRILKQRFLDVDSAKYGILVFDQLHPHMMLVRNRDKAVHFGQLLGNQDAWHGFVSDDEFRALYKAKQYCTSQNLRLSTAMLDNLDFADVTSWEDPMRRDNDDETTSIDTTTSFRETEISQKRGRELQFTFKRRARIEKVTPVPQERLETWVDDLHDSDVKRERWSSRERSESPEYRSHDIIPTVFIMTSEEPRNASRDEKRDGKRKAGRFSS